MSNKEITSVIQDKLDYYGISVRKLSEKTGIKYMNLYNSLASKNRKRTLKPEELVAICKFLDISLDQFYKKGDE